MGKANGIPGRSLAPTRTGAGPSPISLHQPSSRPPRLLKSRLTSHDSRLAVSPSRRLQLLAVALVALLAFTLADRAGDGSHFNPDESRWLSRAYYISALTDPFGTTWADQYMTRGQPPLGSYAMGLGLLLQGRDLETNPPWDFSRPWEENIVLGHKPVAQDLKAGRRASAALMALTSLAVTAIARLFVPAWWAIAAGGLFAVHPFTVYIGSLAMADALFGLLIALAAIAAAALARYPGWRRAVVLGALLGFGGATKLSPLTLVIGLAAGGLLLVAVALPWRRVPNLESRFAALSLIVAATAAATFVASYPYLWPSPVARTLHLFAFRAEEMAAQATDWPEMAVSSRAEAVRRVGVNFGQRFSLTESLASWSALSSAPALLRQIELLVPLAGIVAMIGIAARDGPYSPRALALAVLGGQVAATILGMRSEFDRYHLPMALLGTVAAVVALERLSTVIGEGGDWLVNSIRTRPSHPEDLSRLERTSPRPQRNLAPVPRESEPGFTAKEVVGVGRYAE